MTVLSLNSWRIILCMMLSVTESTEAVASSRTRMLLFFSRALPRQNSCLCPTLQLSPFSTTESPRELQNFGSRKRCLQLSDLPVASKLMPFFCAKSLSWHFSITYANSLIDDQNTPRYNTIHSDSPAYLPNLIVGVLFQRVEVVSHSPREHGRILGNDAEPGA